MSAEESRAQFTLQAATFAGSAHAHQAEAIARFVELASPRATDRALDVGCGPGIISCALAPRVREITGADVTPAMLEQARFSFAQGGLTNGRFVEADAEALPFPAAAFDLIVSRLAFHHFPRPDRVLRELARVLAPGGRIAIFDVVASELAERAALHNAIERLRDPSHARALSIGEMALRLEEAGLALSAFHGMDYALDVADWIARAFPRPGEGDEARRLLAEIAGTSRIGRPVHAREDGGLVLDQRWGIYVARATALGDGDRSSPSSVRNQ